MVGEFVDYNSLNQQILTLKEVLKNPVLRQTNDVIITSSYNLYTNTSTYSPSLIILILKYSETQNELKRPRWEWHYLLISHASIYDKVDNNEFDGEMANRVYQVSTNI